MNQFLGYSFETEKYGWRSIPMDEILTPNAYTAGTLVLYLESIQDNTTGNNPHIGGGTYDNGMSYISGMSEIFNYSLINRNFIGIDDATCEDIKRFKFDVDIQEDNRKCWFFSDADYNEKYGKEAAYTRPEECGKAPKTISFKEVDVTDKICNIRNCNDSKPIEDRCDGSLFYDIATLLNESHTNIVPNVGKDADDVYGRTTNLDTFDPENRVGKNGEAAANSVVNVKNLEIEFNIIPDTPLTNVKKEYRKYIETTVVPYLTQMIPSTTILSWSFNGDKDDVEVFGLLEQKNEGNVFVTVAANLVQNKEEPPQPEPPEPEPIEENVSVEGTLTQVKKEEPPQPEPEPPGPEPEPVEENISVEGTLTQVN
jgi:hypothetical protein